MQGLEKFKKQGIEETAKFFGGQGDCEGTNTTMVLDTFLLTCTSSVYNDRDDEGCC